MSSGQGGQKPSKSLEQSIQCVPEGCDGKVVNLFENPTSLLFQNHGVRYSTRTTLLKIPHIIAYQVGRHPQLLNRRQDVPLALTTIKHTTPTITNQYPLRY